MWMYILFLKTYIRSWKIHTYDLKNMACRQGWMTIDECQWMEGGQTNGRMLMDVGDNYDG
jgi:hypothetical protein